MSYAAAAGSAIALGDYGPGFNAPPLPSDPEVVKLTREVAARAYYAGAMLYLEGYGVLAVFKDPKTGLCYAQPVED